MEDLGPVLACICEETFFEVGSHFRPLSSVRLPAGHRAPAIFEFKVLWKCRTEPIDKCFEELGFQTTNSHETSTFTRIYVVERGTTIKCVGTGFSLPKYSRGGENIMKQGEGRNEPGAMDL